MKSVLDENLSAARWGFFLALGNVIFAIAVIAMTIVASVEYKEYMSCYYYPNIQCSDEYVCENKCSSSAGKPVSPCFSNFGTTGLASCLFGPNSSAATRCYDLTDGACPCTNEYNEETSNCFNSCPQVLASVSDSTNCCAKSRGNQGNCQSS